jgi:radical SAM superfamily enzyme YgiQ (UPF0313 family)
MDHQTDLVALTVETYTARRAYQLAGKFRQRGIPVVMGGYHPSFLPEEALRYADAVVVGDAESIWGQVLVDAEQGQLQRLYRATSQPALAGVHYDRRIFQGKNYKLLAPVQYGRGCRFACEFCSIHAFYGFETRQRPVAEVVAEIEALGRKQILFVDDNLFVDLAKAEELFRALIPLKIRWACQISIDIARDDRLVELMARSGCFGALIGFESLDEDNLRQMKKRWNLKGGDYLSAINKLHDHGIMIYASFLFGYDHDTVDTFDITAEFAVRAKFALVNFSALAPTPGARLYDRLFKEERLIYPRWWLDPTYRYGEAIFQPRRMSADQLTEGCRRARRIVYGYSAILQRAWHPAANARNPLHLGMFLAANLITRRELASKLDRPLGAVEPLDPDWTQLPHLDATTSQLEI